MTTQQEALLVSIDQKLAVTTATVQRLERRVEAVEEMGHDLMPAARGLFGMSSAKLSQLEQDGALDSARELVSVAERVATSFSREDVALLGENIVGILKTVKNLTQPDVLAVADRAAHALSEEPEKKAGLFRTMRDPDVRRGITLMLAVLKELGHGPVEHEETNQAAVAVGELT